MTDQIDLQEFVGGFVAEAHELVGTAHAALAAIESAGGTQPRAVRDLFRALHTIKGLAGMIGVEPIVEIAHALESIVRVADRSGGRLDPRVATSCVAGVDAIAERVRAVSEGRTPASVPDRLLEELAAFETVAAPVARTAMSPEWEAKLSASERSHLSHAFEAGRHVWTVAFLPSDDNATRGITIATVRQQLAEIGEIIKVLPRALPPSERAAAGIAFEILIASDAAPLALAAAGVTTLEWVREVTSTQAVPEPVILEPVEDLPESPAIGRGFVRVEVVRLDALQEQLSLLIISRFRLQRELARLAEHGTDVRRLREISDLQGRQLRDLRRAILQARLVRATEVLEPLSLLVRSLARSSQKAVKLELDAEATELDKSVADRLLPALVHIIRNAVDHAIEPPDIRSRHGKPAEGKIRVACREINGSQIEIVISDDGGGIDREAVARKAGCAIANDSELLDVLTKPGFSTRSSTTQTSGRGLGMDIVRRIIVGDLGGDLAVASREGEGTTFTLRVPVTIAVLDVFSFECGRQSFVVPVSVVEEIFEVEPEQLVRPPAGKFSLLERRGRAVPVISLGQVLAIDDGAAARKALMIRRNGESLAFVVDRLLGRQEVVIRPIEDPLVKVPGIAGATDLGDGHPTLVLDLCELAKGSA